MACASSLWPYGPHPSGLQPSGAPRPMVPGPMVGMAHRPTGPPVYRPTAYGVWFTGLWSMAVWQVPQQCHQVRGLRCAYHAAHRRAHRQLVSPHHTISAALPAVGRRLYCDCYYLLYVTAWLQVHCSHLPLHGQGRKRPHEYMTVYGHSTTRRNDYGTCIALLQQLLGFRRT